MRFDKEKLRQIAIEMAELYAQKTKTNYDASLEQVIYAIIKKQGGLTSEKRRNRESKK